MQQPASSSHVVDLHHVPFLGNSFIMHAFLSAPTHSADRRYGICSYVAPIMIVSSIFREYLHINFSCTLYLFVWTVFKAQFIASEDHTSSMRWFELTPPCSALRIDFTGSVPFERLYKALSGYSRVCLPEHSVLCCRSSLVCLCQSKTGLESSCWDQAGALSPS